MVLTSLPVQTGVDGPDSPSPMARRWGLDRGDGVTALSLFVLLLMGSPSQYVVGPLGAAGTPAQVLAMVMTLWWAGRKLSRPYVASPERQPIRIAMMLFVACGLISYVMAFTRVIVGAESRAADRGLLMMVAWLGVILVAGDHISTRGRLDTLLKRLVLAAALVAALGLLQFFTGQAYTNFLKLPGLTMNSDLNGIGARGGLNRPSSTALSPIEFGVAVTMLLPLTLHYALNDRVSGAFRRWFPVAMVGLAIPFSVSRSAIVCAVVGVALMMPVMSVKARLATVFGGGALLGVVFIAVPGMLGTLTSMFTGVGNDSSAASRTNSYAIAGEFISRSPWLGRGFMTFLPEYRILDNQFLGTLIDLGALGLVALIALFVTGMGVAAQIRRRTQDQATRQLSQALLASLAAGVSSYAFFDAFSFPMVAGLTFLLLGTISSLRRLSRQRSEVVSTVAVGGRHLDTTNLPRLTPIQPVPRRPVIYHDQAAQPAQPAYPVYTRPPAPTAPPTHAPPVTPQPTAPATAAIPVAPLSQPVQQPQAVQPSQPVQPVEASPTTAAIPVASEAPATAAIPVVPKAKTFVLKGKTSAPLAKPKAQPTNETAPEGAPPARTFKLPGQ